MTTAASRAQWVTLKDQLAAARRGHDVLEKKRELLLREVRSAGLELQQRRREVAEALGRTDEAMTLARVVLGLDGVAAAALAFPPTTSLEVRRTTRLGSELPVVVHHPAPFVVRYGPQGTAEELDRAALAAAAAVPRLIAWINAELAWRVMKRSLARCIRRLSGLERRLIPQLQGALAEVAAALEEEERDEAVRRREWQKTVA